MPRRDRPGAREEIKKTFAVAAAYHALQGRQVFIETAEHFEHGVLIVQKHIAPHGRIGRRDAREIAEPTR